MDNHIFHALREHSFRNLWIGEIFTQIAINLFNFLLILIVYSLTQSNTAVSGAVITFTLPAIFFGIVAGACIDRWDKKTVLIVANLLRCILLVILAVFHTNIIIIYFLSFLISLVTQFFIPAETPMIPLVVSNKQLYSANALFGLGIFGSILFAYVLSGPLLAYLGPFNTLLVLAFSFAMGALFISFIKPPYSESAVEKRFTEIAKSGPLSTVIFTDLKEVFSLLFKTKQIYSSIFLLALSQILILTIAVIAPGFASQVLGIKIEEFSYLFIVPAALGVVIGAILIGTKWQHKKKEKLVTVGIFLSSICMILLPYGSKIVSRGLIKYLNQFLPEAFLITNDHILILLALILGIANAFVFVPSNTILQENTSDEFRGKIYGVLNTIVGVFSFVPILVVGGLSDLIGITQVIIGIGGCLFVIGLANIWIQRK